MDFLRRWWWLVLVLLVAIGWFVYRGQRIQPPTNVAGSGDPGGSGTGSASAAGSTDLQFELYGGFAYVPSGGNRLEVAYLEDTNVPDCVVDQLGTELQVVDGTIVEPATHDPSNKFDLDRAVVTFPALESANLPLTAARGMRPTAPPLGPANPNATIEWEDLKWVPNVRAELTNSSLNPDWRNLVNGRVVLRGGKIIGLQPSDVIVKDSLFEFRKNGTAAFKQAVTDRTEYTVRVPSHQIEMLLNGATSTVTRIVVAPRNPGRPVILKLIGKHTGHTSQPLPVGAEIRDYCAFYQLLQPVPAKTEWLLPVYQGSVQLTGTGRAQPSPGAFCPGDWF